MSNCSEFIPALFLLSCLLLATSSRMLHLIRIVALQGILLGILPLLMNPGFSHWQLAAVNLTVKGIILPLLLLRAMKRAAVKRELEPWIGYAESLGVVLLLSALAFYLWIRCAVTPAGVPILAAPVAFTTMITGIFITIARKKALTQVIGFLIFENGITVFGMGMGVECGLLVELGIMLDVLVLVFVMGIAMFHINREFAHIDADRLNHLSEVDDDDSYDAGESEVRS